MTHTERTFERALKTSIGSGDKGAIYILPYEGNLTEKKTRELAEKLVPLLKDKGFEKANVEGAFAWLKSTWYSGREKDMRLTINRYGNIDLTGKGWGTSNYPAHQIVVVE